MVNLSIKAWYSGMRSGAQFASRTVRRFVRFFFHPIWGYTPSQILKAVQRDWDGPIGTSARAILDHMAKEHATKITLEFWHKGEVFLEMDCIARAPKPNTVVHGDESPNPVP